MSGQQSQRGAAKVQLSDAEVQRIAANRARAHELDPGFVALVREFHQAGLIEGWRNVRFVGTPDEWQQHAAGRRPAASCRLKGDEMRAGMKS